jgi:hypothetical protein
MNIKLQVFSFILGILFFLVILYNIKRKKFSPSYSVLWIILSFILILIPIFQSFLIGIARYFGVYAENLVYMLLIGFLLIYVLYLTSKVVRLNNQVKELISNSAILENELKEINKK